MNERRREVARDAGQWGGALVNFLLSSLVAVLPPRWRGSLELRLDLEIQHAALASGAVQLFAGVGLWALGLGAWMQHLLDATAAAAKEQAASGQDMDALMSGYAMIGMNPLLPLIYTLTTVKGFVSAIAGMGGGIRLIYLAACHGNLPDPTLSVIDWAVSRVQTKRAVTRREASKGEATPDRHFPGDGTTCDLRILSREDYPWRDGVGVVVGDVIYRLVARTETRDESGRLRTLYDLRRLEPAEVMRGRRLYQPRVAPRVERAAWRG